MPGNLKLCYVSGSWAYFTTQELNEQDGDDWDDAPYELNAGPPYEYNAAHGDTEPYEIVKVAWEGPFYTPDWDSMSWSVDQINRGCVAWLIPQHGNDSAAIPAGTILEQFIQILESAGGAVYLKQ